MSNQVRNMDEIAVVGMDDTQVLYLQAIDGVSYRLPLAHLKEFTDLQFVKGAGVDSLKHVLADNADGDRAIAIGKGAEADGEDGISVGNNSKAKRRGVSIGRQCESLQDSVAIGYAQAVNSRYSLLSSWPISTSRNSTIGGNCANGSEVYFFGNEINLKSAAAVSFASENIPANTLLFPTEVGLIITEADTVTGQPEISWGETGNTASLLASTATTGMTAAGHKEEFKTLLKNSGIASIAAEVHVAATGTTLKGRLYVKGIIVENQADL
jgi:hypothetical protein